LYTIIAYSFAHLFAKLPQSGHSKMTFAVFRSSYHRSVTTSLACLKGRSILLSDLPKDTTSTHAGLSSHYLFNAEHQTGKLWIPTFKVF